MGAGRAAPAGPEGGGGAGLDPASARALPLDDFAALLLRLGRYRVDPATGTVVGPRGRPMAPQRNPETGYYHVMLSYRPAAKRVITLHRLVAVAAWGLAAVRGRHVVHRDGDRAHNAVANLALVDPPPPTRHPPPPGAVPAAPCARCGTTGGWARAPGRPPARMSGARFGVEGRLCAVCYETLRRQERRRLTAAWLGRADARTLDLRWLSPGRRLALRRVRLGLDRGQVGQAAGLSSALVNAAERDAAAGGHPPEVLQARVAAALDALEWAWLRRRPAAGVAGAAVPGLPGVPPGALVADALAARAAPRAGQPTGDEGTERALSPVPTRRRAAPAAEDATSPDEHPTVRPL